nr:MAG TPA: hypothetical protein [Caudoviricetes sp.]
MLFLSPAILLRQILIYRNNSLSFCIVPSLYIVHYV